MLMSQIKMFLYNLFPKGVKKKLGKSKVLAPIRNSFFRTNGSYKEAQVKINRTYLDYLVQFNFLASIQVANKAKVNGIENTLLKNSIKLLNSEENNKVIFDVGTNFGYLSLVWANTIAKNGKVYSFEPHPILFKSYKKSVQSNHLDNRIIAENVAVGNDLGSVEINLLSTTANTLHLDIHKEKDQKVKVDIISLDHYVEMNSISKCDLIKIDVDGIEYDILNGSKELIKKLQPIFIVETNNDHRIINFFLDHNYSILNMKLEPISEGELPENIFCLPKK